MFPFGARRRKDLAAGRGRGSRPGAAARDVGYSLSSGRPASAPGFISSPSTTVA